MLFLSIRKRDFFILKNGPERLQDTKEKFDVIITAEERVYDQVFMSLRTHVLVMFYWPLTGWSDNNGRIIEHISDSKKDR